MSSETVELRGHIIDSLILPKVLDEILTRGAKFKIAEIKIGQNRVDQSYARIEVAADSGETLDELLLRLRQHGAEVIERADVQLRPRRQMASFRMTFTSRRTSRPSFARPARSWK